MDAASDVAVPASDAAVPASDVAVPASDAAVPASDAAVPASDAAVPASSDAAVPASDAAVPASDAAVPAILPIPIDLFGSKKHKNLPRGELGFVDSSGNPVFRIVRQPKSSSLSSPPPPRRDTKSLLDAAGDPILSIARGRVSDPLPSISSSWSSFETVKFRFFFLCPLKGSWQIFKVDMDKEKELICNVQRTRNSLTRTELEVLVIGESCGSLGSSFKMRGFPFQKSCTIYQGDSIVAQTSLMYKLHQIYVRRGKFRLTIYPGSIDHAFIVALVVIFLSSGK
ncbi:LOW QUALITY PROTEIN: protein LURP-one-related 7 [Eucalyptus grandis]|uniref:LOW QUALITY PROTEIN: protein LURP-one-related 7 n=1 Tax=Eucalyptus grandis TaxID=71139 RepID=UPI00192EB1A1|nr:LOW QUALITY PROTEIN: protein LURP-one-related 7 [Eucalyptus grandis]